MKRLLAQVHVHAHSRHSSMNQESKDEHLPMASTAFENITHNHITQRLETFGSLCDCGDDSSGDSIPSHHGKEEKDSAIASLKKIRLERAKALLQRFTILLDLECLTDGMQALSPHLG